MGVRRGGTVEVSLVGTALEGTAGAVTSRSRHSGQSRAKDRFAVAANGMPSLRDVDVWAATPKGLSNPRRFAVGDLAQVVEREPTTGRCAAGREPPVVIDGAINPATDRDDFRFHLAAGSALSLVFRSESLGGASAPR